MMDCDGAADAKPLAAFMQLPGAVAYVTDDSRIQFCSETALFLPVPGVYRNLTILAKTNASPRGAPSFSGTGFGMWHKRTRVCTPDVIPAEDSVSPLVV